MNETEKDEFGEVEKHDMATNTDNEVMLTSDNMTAPFESTYIRERSLFIGGINDAISERDLRYHFCQFGLIVRVYMKFDFVTGMSRDYAFILYSAVESVKRAIESGEHVIRGHILSARRAKCRNNRIFVSGLPWIVTEEEVMSYFSRYGDITDFQVPYDWEKGHRKSYCFISFISDQVVLNLLNVQHHILRGKSLVIKRATPRTERPAGPTNANYSSSNYNNNLQMSLQSARQAYALHAQQLAAYIGYNHCNNNNTFLQTTLHTVAPDQSNANAAAGNANGYANAAAAAVINNNMGYHYMPYQQMPPANGFAPYAYVNVGAGPATWAIHQPLGVAPAASTPNAYGSVFGNNNFMSTNGFRNNGENGGMMVNSINNPVAPVHCNNYTTGNGLHFGPVFNLSANAAEAVDPIMDASAGDANSNNNSNNTVDEDWEMLDLSNTAPNPYQSVSNSSGFFEGNNYVSNLNASANDSTDNNNTANNENNNTTNNIANNENNNAENKTEEVGSNNIF